MALYNSVEELIGNTPLVRLNRFEEKYQIKAHLYAKLEMFNPAGSIKDRLHILQLVGQDIILL